MRALFFAILLISSGSRAAEYSLSHSTIKAPLPAGWQSYYKYLDFSVLFVSPLENGRRNSVGVLEYRNFDLIKFFSAGSFKEDQKEQKINWLKRNHGVLESAQVIQEKAENLRLEFTYKISNQRFIEVIEYKKCGNTTLQIKAVIPEQKDRYSVESSKKFASSIECRINGTYQ